MTRYFKLLVAFYFAAMLAACGGGGGSAGTTTTGGTGSGSTPTLTPTALVADLAIYTDKTTIANSGTDKVVVTVVAVNANRNALAGASITVAADKNSVFAPDAASTDSAGTYTGALTIGSDRSNRLITITATANGVTKQTTVQVADIATTGPTPVSVADFALLTDKSSITNTGTDTAVLTVVAVDAKRNVVAGAAVSVSAGQNAIFTPNGTTNLTNASGIFSGTVSAGSDKSLRTIQLQVTVNGITKSTPLDVVLPSVVIPTTPGSGTTTTPTGPVIVPVTDMVLFMDKPSITNSGTDKGQLTVIALDVNRNVVSGATVAVTTDQNSVFIPTAGTTTNAQGTYTGNVFIGSDKSNRTITVTVTINGIVRRTSVQVIGSRLTIQAQPSTLAPGQSGTISALLQDSSLNAIPGATITLGGTVPGIAGQTVVTDFSGQASQTFTAPAANGSYSIGATGNGVSAAPSQIQVVTAGVVPNAVIPAGAVPSLSASPNVLAVNTVGSTSNRSNLRFLFLDGSGLPLTSGRPVTNVRVRFDDITTGLAALGSSITSGTQTLITDNSGVVTAQYISGQNSSPTNGVTIRACFSAIDPVPAPAACQVSGNYVDTTLTVAGAALAVSIGDDNVLSSVTGTYIKRFAITVADSAGKAVANAPVDISLDLTHYGKSTKWGSQSLSTVPTLLTADATVAASGTSTTFYWCHNEDLNRNGVADVGENVDNSVDANGQPTLQPRRSDMIISYDDPLVTTTNASGVLIIRVQYSQRYGGWLAYKVRVTANVAGSQGLAERAFVTDVLQGDVPNGSFLTPAYGVNNCTTAN
jgi:hypothetical protein